jgi:hypothetical protein
VVSRNTGLVAHRAEFATSALGAPVRAEGLDEHVWVIPQVIGATNRKADLDPALLSRFDLAIAFGLPDEACRYGRIRMHTRARKRMVSTRAVSLHHAPQPRSRCSAAAPVTSLNRRLILRQYAQQLDDAALGQLTSGTAREGMGWETLHGGGCTGLHVPRTSGSQCKTTQSSPQKVAPSLGTAGMSGRDLRDVCETTERRWASKARHPLPFAEAEPSCRARLSTCETRLQTLVHEFCDLCYARSSCRSFAVRWERTHCLHCASTSRRRASAGARCRRRRRPAGRARRGGACSGPGAEAEGQSRACAARRVGRVWRVGRGPAAVWVPPGWQLRRDGGVEGCLGDEVLPCRGAAHDGGWGVP